MPNPTVNDLHVDGVRTELSLMFANSRDMLVGDAIAPIVPVNKQSDVYATWSRADTLRIQAEQVAPSAPSPTGSLAVSTTAYFCLDYRLNTLTTEKERANAAGEFELDQAKVKWLNEQILLRREKVVADTLFQSGTWATDVVVGTKWSATSSDPYGDLETGMDAVELATGVRPNYFIAGTAVWTALKHHADTLDRVKGGSTNSDPAKVTPEQIAAEIGVSKVLRAAAVYNSASAGAAVTMARLYEQHDALLIYRPETPAQLEQSAAYTFSWSQFDNVDANGASIRSWPSDNPLGEFLEVEANFAPTLTSDVCGYYFDAATS